MVLDLTDSEIDSLRMLLGQVYLTDYSSRIVEDAHAVLTKLKDRDLATYIALGPAPRKVRRRK